MKGDLSGPVYRGMGLALGSNQHQKYYWARPSGNGGTLLLYFALVLLIYPMLSKITTGTI